MKFFVKTYRFGTERAGALDYGVYELSSEEYDAPGKTVEELRIESAVAGEPMLRHNVCAALYGSFPEVVPGRLGGLYNDMVAVSGSDRQIDLITVEFDSFVFVRYCRLGQWFAFGEMKNLGLEDQTRWGDKRNYFAVWDGKHWVRPCEYGVEPLSEDIVR